MRSAQFEPTADDEGDDVVWTQPTAHSHTVAPRREPERYRGRHVRPEPGRRAWQAIGAAAAVAVLVVGAGAAGRPRPADAAPPQPLAAIAVTDPCAQRAYAPGRTVGDLAGLLAACANYTPPAPSPSGTPTPSGSPSPSGSPTSSPSSSPTASPSPSTSSSPAPTASPTSSPSPTVPPVGCVKPDGTNTGQSFGAPLTASGGLTIPAGTTHSGLDITGHVTVRGTLLHSRIRGTLSVIGAGRVEHVEIDGLGAGSVVYAQGSSASVRATMRYLNIFNGSDGGRFDGWVEMTNSWVHGLLTGPGAHSDGVQSTGGPYQTYRCNRVEGGNTSSFIIAQDGCGCGNPAHVVFDRNWFEGQSGPGWTTSFAVYANGGASDFDFTGNTFSRVGGTVRDWPKSQGQTPAVDVWTGNVYTDGAPVSKP